MTITADNTAPVTVVLTLKEKGTIKIEMSRPELNRLAHEADHTGGYSRLTHDGTDSNGFPFVVDVTQVIALHVES